MYQIPLNYTISLVKRSNNTESEKYDGRLIGLSQSVPLELSDGGNTIKLNFDIPGGAQKNFDLKIIAPVNIVNGKARRKIIIRDKVITVPKEGFKLFQNGNCAKTYPSNDERIPLKDQDGRSYSDIFKLNYVRYIVTKDGKEVNVDITDNYVLDDGQRDTYYSIGSIIRRDQAAEPDVELEVSFDYFEHDTSVDADFFSVDSYTHDQGIPFGEIPVFRPVAFAPEKQMTTEDAVLEVQLRDCVDFRPAV